MSHKSLETILLETQQIESELIQAAKNFPHFKSEKLTSYLKSIEAKPDGVDGYKYLLERLKMNVVLLEESLSEYEKLIFVFESFFKEVKSQLKLAMEQVSSTSLVGHEWVLKLKINKPSYISNVQELPEEFKKKETLDVPNGDLIRQELEKGSSIPGVIVEERFEIESEIKRPL